MIRGKELEPKVYDVEHVERVIAEIEGNFPDYCESFRQRPVALLFDEDIAEYEKEQQAYRDYLDLEKLKEWDYDPNAFKSHTRKKCPIIRRCLNSNDEIMKSYRKSFNLVSGRELLDTVRNLAEFGASYAAGFDWHAHENAATYGALGLEPLNETQYGCIGVVGYGIQSSLLYGLYPHCFAHRSQDAVWSLYFLSGRKHFGLRDGSEFLMVQPNEGICEQNYFYPAELFGFYALTVFLMLRRACEERGIQFRDRERYVYLSTFCEHVADMHRDDINTFRWSSDHVEKQPWF